MFTLDQIKAAHGKVKSGADFPAFIRELKKLGVKYYQIFVADGHADYFGTDDYKITSPPNYDQLEIAPAANEEQFKSDLKTHQTGKTDYPAFCKDAANAGIEKWVVSTDEMTCTYYDIAGNEILLETIPD